MDTLEQAAIQARFDGCYLDWDHALAAEKATADVGTLLREVSRLHAEIERQKQIYAELLTQSHRTTLDCLSARTTALKEAAAICRRRAGPFGGVGLVRVLIEAAEEIEGLR